MFEIQRVAARHRHTRRIQNLQKDIQHSRDAPFFNFISESAGRCFVISHPQCRASPKRAPSRRRVIPAFDIRPCRSGKFVRAEQEIRGTLLWDSIVSLPTQSGPRAEHKAAARTGRFVNPSSPRCSTETNFVMT